MDESETETFWKSKVEQDRDETESRALVSRQRREHDETLTKFLDFHYFGMIPGPRRLERKTNGRDRYLSIIKIGARLRRDRESLCL
jgi:hypothetical protein